MQNLFSLEGRVALVTGGSRGIGAMIAKGFLVYGAKRVYISARKSAACDAMAEALSEFGECISLPADVSTMEGMQGLADRILAKEDKLDILVNNAGIIRRADSIDFSEADWDAVMDTNLKVVFFLTQAFARQVLKQGPVNGVAGKVINIASLLSFQGGIRVPSYTASKSGLAGLTKILANEWATKGINVNAIAPGYFDTNNTEALRNDADRNASILARIPAARWGKPSDLGGAAVFLASPAADYVQGITLPVDGGWLAR